MKRIDVPGVGLVDFPDSMTDADITSAIETDILKTPSKASTPKEPERTFGGTVKEAAGYIKDNALRLPLAIADELRTKSVVDGMDGKEVKPDQAAAKSFKKVIEANKKPNTLNKGAEIVDGFSGVAKVGLNRGYAGLGKMEAGLIKSIADITDSETLAKIAENQNAYAKEVENRAVLRGTPVEGFAKESIVQDLPEAGANAISSVINTAPALVVGAATGGSALPAMFGGVALQEYNEGREKDLSPLQSAFRSAPMAAAEVVGEKLGGFDKLTKGLNKAVKGNGIAELGTAMLESSLKELPAEEFTTTLQFLVDKTPEIGLNQNATFEDYKQAVKDTALATILQSSGMGAGGAILTSIANKLDAPAGTNEAEQINKQLLAAFNASQQKQQDQAKTAEADNALANITNPDATVEDAIALAEKAMDIPAAPGLLNSITDTDLLAQVQGATEAINAADILGDDNVSNTNDAATGVVTGAIESADNQPQGSLDDLSLQPDGSGLGNATATLTPGEPGNVATGTGSNTDSTLDRPFAAATDDFLPQMRSMTTDATVISQIDAEIVLRGIDVPSAVEVAGEKINKEWTAFNPDTGTLNIPRSEMPQIKAEHRGAMVNFLNARGISHEQETVPASSLKPTQQEFSEAKVKQASEYVGGDRSILVSSDNHVLDGHHQWLSKLQNEDNVDVIRLNAPIKDLLANVSEFPSAQVAEGAKEVSTQKPKAAKPKAPKIKSLLTTINDLGGILNSEKLDITGEQRGFAPGGYNKIFKLNSKRSLKGLIEGGDLDDYLPYNMRLEANGANDDAFDSTEAYDYLADKIRNGESVLPYAVEEELRALQYEGNAVNDVADELTEDEINGQLQQASNEERESATNARVFNTDSENGSARSSERTESAAETNTDQQAEVAPQGNQDLLGDDTAAKQAIADAERAKDTRRNSGNDNQDNFTLTGSNSEADIAAAAGAQDLFAATKVESNPQDEVVKATEALTAAGVKGKEKLDTIKDVRQGNLTADEVAEAYAEPTSQEEEVQTPLSLYDNAMDEYGQGIANADDYKAAFNYVINNKEAITEYLEANFTKQQLFDRGGARLESRYKSEKKYRVVSALYADMVSDFLLPGESGLTSYSYGFGEDKYKSIKSQVEAITQESLDKAMDKLQEAKAEREARLAERKEGMQDPKTLDDYTNYLRGKMGEGMSLKEARMTLTPDQRETYDNLYAERTIADRAGRKEAAQTSVSVAGQKVEGSIIETKHTQKGHDLFVVQLSERVSKDDYNTLNVGAKKLGGYYSSFRGRGAVPGFQFTTKENAEAFVQLAGGDNAAAKEQAKERRNAFDDDKSQNAVERLNEMADRLEDKADEELGRERKSNTSRRAGMAARAEAAASADKAMAITMRNIAQAIESGAAKYLGKLRQKVQVELLQSLTSAAQYTKMREQYPAYGDYEKHQHDAPTKDTADYSEFPTYSLYRSDLANLGRSMVEIDGLKILGNRILSVADDVTDAYLKFAKENIHKVSRFTTGTGERAAFSSKSLAEEAIKRSGFKGKAIVLPFKRGENIIIDSPSAAKERGVWDGDDDKQITLSADLGKDIVEKIGKANRKSSKLNMPWQFENAYDKREKLARMGIETPAEMRAALREFIGLKENTKQPDKIKELERKMIGRRNDGLDFFPTPANTADEMIDAADIKEGMSVLEPSAGMGHIAERIREYGNEPDVVEFSGDRRELLELKGFNVVGSDFLDVTEKYDRIIMNPPFSDRRDEEHVRHAYNLLKPNGKLVAIMGEGVFFGSDKRATEFRDWLESVGGTSEKLEEGTFKDASLPVNTSVNARMVVVEKQETDNDGVAMFSRGNSVSTPIFYSALSNAIGEIKTNKAQGSIWKGMIKNLTQKGVKPDEIEWTGVNEWLDLQQDSVTKEQVVDYLNSNGVQVTETMLGDKWRERVESRMEEINDEVTKLVEEFGIIPDLTGDAKVKYESLEKEFNDLDDRLRSTPEYVDETKYEKYTVAGGENYKELLLTLPSKSTIDENLLSRLKINPVDYRGEERYYIEKDGDPNALPYVYYTQEEAQDALNRMVEIKPETYKSGHFDQKNILAHIRFDERTDADGNKTLFIQEIQSDWHQAGKKNGYGKQYSYAITNENGDFAGEYKSLEAAQNAIATVKNNKPDNTWDIVKTDDFVEGVPDAPFKKTDAWVALALKRMVRYAAENGFDKVAFINGQQAADLYDLSKQISSITAKKWSDDNYGITAKYPNGQTQVLGEFSKDKLPDVVGKELAERIINEASNFENETVKTYAGLDLKVGGEGMHTFYDSIVPKVAKDVLKKVGGSISNVDLSSDEIKSKYIIDAEDIGADEDMAQEVIIRDERTMEGVVEPFNSIREAEAWLDKNDVDTSANNQLGFTITPEMREKVMGGLPLFKRDAVKITGLPKASVQKAVNAIRANWKNAPEIIVVDDMNDPAIRKAVREENDRQLSQGAQGQPEGFFDAGKVYIVASEMNSADDVIRVVFHEALGHYGLRGLYGKELGAILDQIAMLRKSDMAAKAKEYGLDLNVASDKRIAAEEVLAEIAQTAPGAGFVKRAIAAIRNFLRAAGIKLKLTDNDIIVNYLLPARGFVVNGRAEQGVRGLVAAFARDNRSPSKESGDTFITAALEFTARNEELFENPTSEEKSIDGIAKALNTKFRVEPFGKSQTKLDGAEKAWEVFLPDAKYRSAVIYEKGDEVWINVSRLQSGGDFGSRIYSLAADYAINNDKVFIGDPLGLSEKAFYRRAESMLSSALKYGTTKHIAPHLAQEIPAEYYESQGNAEFGKSVRPIKWIAGDDVNNIKELIYTVYKGAIDNLPELKNVIFNPTTQQFETVSGEQFTTDDFERVLSGYYERTTGNGRSSTADGSTQNATINTTQKSNSYRAGIRTAKRAALFNTFLREQSSELRNKVLGSYVRELQNRGLADSLKGTFYSRSNPQSSVPEETRAQATQRVIQDKFNRFKVLQDWVISQGVNLSEAADVFLSETLMSGRISTRKEDFREGFVKPLIERTQSAGITMEQVGDYLKVQHAPEANKRARELQGDVDATAYGISDADAAAAMKDFKALPNFAELKTIANEWRSITDKTKQIKLDSGLLTPEMVAAWENTYDVYVPVKGGDDNIKAGLGKGLHVNGKTKQRLGHGLRDEAIIENILRDHESAITLDEKNRVGKALIKFALEVQNDDIITISKPVKRKVLKQGETAYVVAHKGLDLASFDTRLEANMYIQAQAALGATRSDFSIDKTKDPVRVMLQASPMLADNEVNVYIAGHAVRVQINDEIAAREYKNLGVEHLNSILGASREINNFLSKVYTGYSPDFILTNPIRDAIQGFITLTGNEGFTTAAKIFANYPNAVKELVKHFKNKGSSSLVNEYRAMGGSTGGAYLSDLERIGNDIQASFDEYSGARATYDRVYTKSISEGKSKKTAHTMAALKSGISGFKKIPVIGHFLSLMENLNAITENALRVATYKTLSESGMSKAKSAAQAKNLMNFNRKGEKSNAAGALYLFFNPSIQGTKLIYDALFDSPHKNQARALAGSMTLAAITVGLMQLSGDDEDKEKWNNTPDYVKDGNLVIDMFGVQVTITLPYGYRMFWTLGNVILDAQQGKDLDKLAIRLASSVFENVSAIGKPIDENGDINLFQVLPTTPKMAVGATELVNQDNFGNPITPRKWKESTPDSQLMNRGTYGSLYDTTASGLNSITGGSDFEAGLIDVSPETLKYWVKSLTGGTGQFVLDSGNIIINGLQGVAPQDARDIPVVRRFVRETGIRDLRAAFWERKNEADVAAGQLADAKKARDIDAFTDLADRKGVLASMAKVSNRMIKMANVKRDLVAEIKADETLSLSQKIDEINKIENEEAEIYDMFISMYDNNVK